jgi:cytochrome c556
MTRKDFQAIADALAYTKPEKKGVAMEQWRKTVREMARMCRGKNPRFDEGRFLSAAPPE